MRVFGITGRKNHGKTTLVERLTAHFTADGLTVSTVKHTHHAVDLDPPGRDSRRHREAGARETVLASASRLAFLQELRGAPEWSLARILARMSPVDLILVEGYKPAPHPKIEVFRQAAGGAPLAPEIPSIRAIAGDPAGRMPVPVIALDDLPAVAAFVLANAVPIAAVAEPAPQS